MKVFSRYLMALAMIVMLGGVTCGEARAWRIRFDDLDKLPSNSAQALRDYISTTLQDDPALYKAAAVDLNGDDINEYLLGMQDCVEGRACMHYALAVMDRALVRIGIFRADRIDVEDEREKGVLNIRAYESGSESDYAYRRYVWEPEKSRYTEPEPVQQDRKASG